VRYAGVVRASSAVWIVGGERAGRELDAVLRLDPRSGSVRRVARLPHPLGHEAVAAVGRRLLVVGGRTAPDTVTRQMWWFDPGTARWTAAGTLPYPVADASSVVSGRHLYLFGGEAPDFTDRVTRVSWGR
jgi:N-acetylneuraminic acid mutarotase